MSILRIPNAPKSIQKGFPLKLVLDKDAISQLAENLKFVYEKFNKKSFVEDAMQNIAPLGLTDRSIQISECMRKYLPEIYSEAIEIIRGSLTPPLDETEDNGLAGMFYMPHCHYIAKYGVDPVFNNGKDPFDLSMDIQYELTKRFTCEFSIRSFLINDENRTLKVLKKWIKDKDPHVRRLCSEGTRPRLPWAKKIDSFVKDPSPTIPILEALKNDPELYVRRSVANHIGDIAKDHLTFALNLCESWLNNASTELKWVIRHALRNPAKKGIERAINIRLLAK